MNERVPESREVREHAWWKAGAGFRWQRPRLTVYRPADTRRRAMWNRYPHNVIGAAVVAFGRCWSLTWKGSRPAPSGHPEGGDERGV